MLARMWATIGLIAIGWAAPALSQDDARNRPPGGEPEAIIYRDPGYRGPAMAAQRPERDLRLAWPVRSIRIQRGVWQLCSLRDYNGTCITVAASISDLGTRLGPLRRLWSMRPIQPSPPTPPPMTSGSLRGMGAEFFPAPTNGNGGRVQSCRNGGSTANCAAQTADQFCRAAGWNGAAYQSQQTEGRRVYLADVLCVRSGF